MKLEKKITIEDFYEEYFNEYEEAIKEFWGGQEASYSNGFEDEIYNYRQLLKFFGKNIVAEEKEAEAKIKEAWQDDEDIRFQYSHVRSLREFTLHATFISIHSMYEGRLREYCIILTHYGKVTFILGDDNTTALISKINKNVPLVEKIKSKNNLRNFYRKIRNTIVHHKSYLNSKDQDDLALINEIKQNKYLALTSCSVGKFDHQLHIKKSNFLADYLSLIDQDLKIICRSA